MGKLKKYINSSILGFIVIGVIILALIVFGINEYIKDEYIKDEYIKSLDKYELFIYKLKEEEKLDQYETIKDLVDEHMTNKREYGEIEENISADDYAYMKELYNESIENLYIESDNKEKYNLDIVLEQAYSDEILRIELDEFIDIQRELLTSEVNAKLYTDELEKVLLKEEQDRIAWEKEFEKELKEKKVYEFMTNQFNVITNFGDTYVPEIHDPMIAELASEEFGITPSEADKIYIKFAMEEFK